MNISVIHPKFSNCDLKIDRKLKIVNIYFYSVDTVLI
jgi:hypothetical protein